MIQQQITSPDIASIKSSNRNKKPNLIIQAHCMLNSKLYLILGILVLFIFMIHPVSADSYLPLIGGSGGGKFQARCLQGQYLTGFELRAGDDVDAIRPVCIYAYANPNGGAPEISIPSVTSGWFGGSGGRFEQLLCPSYTPFVTGMYIFAEGRTVVVNSIHLFCSNQSYVVTPSSGKEFPSAIFEAPTLKDHDYFIGVYDVRQNCPFAEAAIGIYGRSGIWLDAVGLICNNQPFPPKPKAISLGKARITGKTTQNSDVCQSARSARARNSPAASALEAQCRAKGEIHYKSLGRLKTSATTNAPPRTICESAQSARARNSPAASALEAQCRASQETQTKMIETKPVDVQNPALETVVPNPTNAEDTKVDPNTPELDWPTR